MQGCAVRVVGENTAFAIVFRPYLAASVAMVPTTRYWYGGLRVATYLRSDEPEQIREKGRGLRTELDASPSPGSPASCRALSTRTATTC